LTAAIQFVLLTGGWLPPGHGGLIDEQVFLAAAIASVQLLAAQAAGAATFIFTPSFSSPNDGDGLTFTSKFSQNGAYTFNLNPSSSHTLTDFLKISTKDTNSPSFLHTNEENDPLSVVFNFSQPSNGSGTVAGTGSETVTGGFFGLTAADGTITWTPSLPIAFGASLLTIVLSLETFHDESGGFFDPANPNQSVNVDATFTLIATPIPAALPLFASALGALCFAGWRRKRKAATA
jgi:hypothetical protein